MRKLLLILFVLSSIAVLAQSRGFTQTDDKINNHIFSGEWLQAKSMIEQQIRMNPDHPKYYFMKAYMYYLSRYFTDTGMTRDYTINDATTKAIP